MDGHQRCTSETQLESVDSGPMTMKGPNTPWERRWANRPMVCTCEDRIHAKGVRHAAKKASSTTRHPSHAHADVSCHVSVPYLQRRLSPLQARQQHDEPSSATCMRSAPSFQGPSDQPRSH